MTLRLFPFKGSWLQRINACGEIDFANQVMAAVRIEVCGE